jgi:hypothetical protein
MKGKEVMQETKDERKKDRMKRDRHYSYSYLYMRRQRGLNWLRTVSGLCEHGNETSGFIKAGNLVTR